MYLKSLFHLFAVTVYIEQYIAGSNSKGDWSEFRHQKHTIMIYYYITNYLANKNHKNTEEFKTVSLIKYISNKYLVALVWNWSLLDPSWQIDYRAARNHYALWYISVRSVHQMYEQYNELFSKITASQNVLCMINREWIKA